MIGILKVEIVVSRRVLILTIMSFPFPYFQKILNRQYSTGIMYAAHCVDILHYGYIDGMGKNGFVQDKLKDG